MGVFKKLKDVLFDDVEEEIPVIVKKEEKPEIIRKPEKIEKEIIPEDTIKEIKIPREEVPERESKKPESSFNFPMDIDEKPPTRSNRNFGFEEEQKRKPEPRNFSKFLNETPSKEVDKQFKPTPIISPVYGILDQNYSKDDVIVKTDIGVKGPNLDEVRKRAYGIEDKKENVRKAPIKKTIEQQVQEEFEDPIKTLDDLLMDEDNYDSIKSYTEPVKEKIVLEDEAIDVIPPLVEDDFTQEINMPNIDDTLETDLFNLIDSMYEDKEESEEE